MTFGIPKLARRFLLPKVCAGVTPARGEVSPYVVLAATAGRAFSRKAVNDGLHGTLVQRV